MANLIGPAPAPITASELYALRDRITRLADDVKGMEGTMMYRLALDADHLGLLIDRRLGQKRFEMWVQVKQKIKAKKRAPKKSRNK